MTASEKIRLAERLGLFVPASVIITSAVLELRFASRLPLMLTQ